MDPTPTPAPAPAPELVPSEASESVVAADAAWLSSPAPVAALFTASWCTAGGLLAAALAADRRVVAVDTDAEPHLADRFAVTVLPTLLVVVAGSSRTRLVGAFSAADVLAALDAADAAEERA